MIVGAGVQCALILVFCIYMVRGYADPKQTPLIVYIIVIGGWFISFSVLVFIPLDIYLTEKYEWAKDDSAPGDGHILFDYWAISYWSSYLFNWLIIPIIMGYVTAGEFSFYDKIYKSFLRAMPYYVLYMVSFIVLLGIIFWIDSNNNDNSKDILGTQGILAVIIALSLAFGFLLLITLLGYSLVKIPIRFWVYSDYQWKLNRILFEISNLEEQITKQQNQLGMYVQISHAMNVEEDVEIYKKVMLSDIE